MSKNKVFSLLYCCSCVVNDQWRICNVLRGNLVQKFVSDLKKSLGRSFFTCGAIENVKL